MFIVKRKLLKFKSHSKPLIVAGFFLLMIIILIKMVLPVYHFIQQEEITPEVFLSLLFSTKPPLKNINGRTSILLMGIAGGDHAGEDLTDSMMVLSLNYETNDTVLISIPRDIWVPSMKDKINTAYHYGESRKKGGGFILAKAAAGEVTGQSIQYVFLIDFSGFVKLIDVIGGIDVEIEEPFDDPTYPIEGRENDTCDWDPNFSCRYEKLHFDRGLQHMDGATALKFVRSRHAQGNQGTDFARGKRQQLILLAVKDKLNRQKIFTNLLLLKTLIEAFKSTIITDLTWPQRFLLGKYFLSGSYKIRNLALDSGDEQKNRPGLLINPPVSDYDGAWVLIPKDGDFGTIHEYLSCHIENQSCSKQP